MEACEHKDTEENFEKNLIIETYTAGQRCNMRIVHVHIGIFVEEEILGGSRFKLKKRLMAELLELWKKYHKKDS